jgi:hypothetical protein
VDKKEAVFLHSFWFVNFWIISLFYQVKTEAGSAGEQPARDTLDD